MPIPAQLQTTGRAADRRTSPRHKISLGSSVDGERVTIHDLSTTGMLIETAAELHVFDVLEIDLPESGMTSAFVIWRSGRYFGCEFREPVFQATVSAARLLSPPAIELAHVQLPLERTTTAPTEQNETITEDKASLSLRLRVIFGSAIVLWALIIWAMANLIKSARGFLG